MTNTATRPTETVAKVRRSQPFAGTRLQLLDCLRAAACLSVIYCHSPGCLGLKNGWTAGGYGVSLFCVLSGFLITSLLIDEEQRTSRLDIVAFLQRRTLRIMPIYFLVLFTVCLFLKTGLVFKNHASDVSLLFSFLPSLCTFTLNYDGVPLLNHFWSVAIEEQFYCCLPIVLLLAKTRTQRLVSLAAIATVLPFCFHTGVVGYIAFFPLVVGAILAFVKERTPKPPSNSAVIVLVCLSLLISSAVIGMSPYGPISTCCFAFLIWLAARKDLSFKWLEPIAYIGRIGLYRNCGLDRAVVRETNS